MPAVGSAAWAAVGAAGCPVALAAGALVPLEEDDADEDVDERVDSA